MAISTAASSTGLLNLERELVCFICTEILYQPLTLIDCLHTFCGACLKEWFSHQHRKATSSHSSSSSSSPYTCPTCRGTVKEAQQNAMVNTLLDMFLGANPGRARNEQEKHEMAQIYKPGDNILPKVEARRRERRGRRDESGLEARERRMVEEARERSLRELHGSSSTSQDTLQPPTASRQSQSSRSRDREERRARRREQTSRTRTADRDRETESATGAEQHRRESTSATVPASSPRNPEAVEARQRQQTVIHQASLASLISSSESTTDSSNSDSLNETRIMQEILAEGIGLLDGIDVDALTEREQDALAERIAEAYRQRRRERNQRNNPVSESTRADDSANGTSTQNELQVDESRRHERSESGSRQHRADTVPSAGRNQRSHEQARTSRTRPVVNASTLPPSAPVVVTHRRRASSQGQRSETSRNISRQSSPTARSSDPRSRSTTLVNNRSQSQDRAGGDRATNTDVVDGHANRARQIPQITGISHQDRANTEPANTTGSVPVEDAGPNVTRSNTSPNQSVAELPGSDALHSNAKVQTSSQRGAVVNRRASGLYDEPSMSCFKCHRADIQYDVYKHCSKCDVDLCLQCYRTGRGCKHWYGFGRSAMPQFEAFQPASYEQMELPHMLLMGRQYQRPEQSSVIRHKLAKDGTTVIPLQTTSNPASRFLEGQFCDRCNAFANSCFWACDYCNYGEWGFCSDCVDTHHCCTHPLLPSAHKDFASATSAARPADEATKSTLSEPFNANLGPSSTLSQPSSAASAFSATAGPMPEFIHLAPTPNCAICCQPIQPASLRFHCPFHDTPNPNKSDAKGNFDICSPCYQDLVRSNRIKREDGSAGWRKCPAGHRMIIANFQPDNEGGHWRRVQNDLVGGWKSPDEAMSDWNMVLEARREQHNGGDGHSSPDSSTARRFVRARTSSYPDPASPTIASPFSSSGRFPPDGGIGLRGTAWWANFPEVADRGPNELIFPSGAVITEIRINNEDPDWCEGVYAGDRGLLPTSYVKNWA